MHTLMAWATLFAVMTCSTGCATIFAGGPSVVEVDARAHGNQATIVMREEGGKRVLTSRRSQIRIELNKRIAYRVEASVPGHSPHVYLIERRVHPVAVLNATPIALAPVVAFYGLVSAIAFGPENLTNGLLIAAGLGAVGLTGFAIDAATGNLWRHDPKVLEVHLAPIE